jgi:hypothetical protein
VERTGARRFAQRQTDRHRRLALVVELGYSAAQEEHVSIGSSLKAVVQKREQRACWFYGLWLAGYCVLAFVATAYAAILGQDYRWPMFILLVPAVVGCVQFRFPTLLGWALLFIPTALAGVVVLCVFPWLVKGTVVTGDWGQVLVGALLLTLIGAVLHGLIRYRPIKN